MTKDACGELFLMQVRGALATAFLRRGIVPTHDQWGLLTAEDMTARDIAEICYALDVEPCFNIAMHADEPQQAQP